MSLLITPCTIFRSAPGDLTQKIIGASMKGEGGPWPALCAASPHHTSPHPTPHSAAHGVRVPDCTPVHGSPLVLSGRTAATAGAEWPYRGSVSSDSAQACTRL